MPLLPTLFESVPDDPFYQPRRPLWRPPGLVSPPALSEGGRVGQLERRFALLLNPFYPKDPHASFGKHVLTPTLALTSIAGATPPHWRVRYWDENLLQGPPPIAPMPEVVGITVHLTFARRAYEVAGWFRARGTKVILGGLHVLSCPEEAAPHADAIAVGDGVQLWPEILRDIEHGVLKPRYQATYERPYDLDPPPRRELLPRRSFLTTASLIATRGCHNRCGFVISPRRDCTCPIECATRRTSVASSRAIDSLTPCSSITIWVRVRPTCAPFAAPCGPCGKSVVFRPRQMTPEELALGYDWLYRRLFSPASIWRRRPCDPAAVLPYLAMSYLYKRSNRFWHLLIKHRLVHSVWRPLVEWTRLRHLSFRRRLEARARREDAGGKLGVTGHVVSAGV